MTEVEARHAAPDAGVHAFDNPEAYIPSDRRRALAAGVQMPDRVEGAAVFADISGFTPLTEALATELGPQRGSEELTANLNRVFHAIIAELHRFGGDVIYFSGDAITCWIEEDDGLLGVAAALAMQGAMERVGRIATPSGAEIPLAMKVAVAVGAARRFVVGSPDLQLHDVLAGRLVDDLADAEHYAGKGEVVLDPSAVSSLGTRVEIDEFRVDEETGRRFGVVARLALEVADAPQPPRNAPLPRDVVEEWILPAVYERMNSGRGEFLAELRPAFPFFVRFGGIDYDDDDDAIRKLNEFVMQAQRVLASYGGNLLQLTLGDKGAYLYAVFGSPLAHEDDAARAAAAALEIRDLERTTAAEEIQIGITRGRLRSGTYGHEMRRTFVCLGDEVNLSARLMSKAPSGQIYVSERVKEAAGKAFTWEPLGEMTMKGKSKAVPVFALSGANRRQPRRATRYDLPIFGRSAELERLSHDLDTSLAGHGRIVGLSAEAGMGKSRLVAEFARTARRRGILVAFGECQAFGAHIAYFPWQEVWRTILRVDESLPVEEQVRSIEAELGAIEARLAPRAPLLASVLGLPIPENDMTRSLDAKVRKSSLEGLLVRCLRARAEEGPVAIVLEDCHWLDELSLELLDALARITTNLPVLMVLAYRPWAETDTARGVERMPHFTEMTLGELDHHHAGLFIRSKLEQRLGRDTHPPDALVELVITRSQGNPFYIEELLNYIEARGVDVGDEPSLRALELPDSLHSLILSRIDTVGESPRRTLKVASVLGRSFPAADLPAVYPELGSLEDVRNDLGLLQSLDLVIPERDDTESFIFKHVVTQEVAYESLPFAIRAELHENAGDHLEASAGDPGRVLDLLAHHYWLSRNDDKKRRYLRLAGESAQAKYANAAATDYLERLVPLLADSDRPEVLLRLGNVLALLGEWDRAQAAYEQALSISEDVGDRGAHAWAEAYLGDLNRIRGEFDTSEQWLESALDEFESLGDRAGEGKVLQIIGTLGAMRGAFETAREKWEASLAVRRQLNDRPNMGEVMNNLAVMSEHMGDDVRARAIHEQSVALQREVGDKRRIALTLMNLGNVVRRQGETDEAGDILEESLGLWWEVGERFGIWMCLENLGNVRRAQGKLGSAAQLLGKSLSIANDSGERSPYLAGLLESIAGLAALGGRSDVAVRLDGAAVAFRETIGAPRGPGDEEDLGSQLDAARTALGSGIDDIFAEGRALSLPDAVGIGLALCEEIAQSTAFIR
jgi:class 3 adenylate cyclase/tetratricopeptide (TPR) repeat protein